MFLFWPVEHPGQVPGPFPLDVGQHWLLSHLLLDVLELQTQYSSVGLLHL